MFNDKIRPEHRMTNMVWCSIGLLERFLSCSMGVVQTNDTSVYQLLGSEDQVKWGVCQSSPCDLVFVSRIKACNVCLQGTHYLREHAR